MGLAKFTIALDSARRVFHSGELVTGVVTIVVDKKPKCQHGVVVMVEGKACLHLHSGRDTQEESLFKPIKLTLKRGGIPIGVGTHRFPFRFCLPNIELPCSFEGRRYHVRYTARASLVNRSKPDTWTKKATFQVRNALDLNNAPVKYCQGVSTRDCTDLSFPWWSSGLLVACAKLDKSGYGLGERARVNLRVSNQSGRTVRVKTTLYQMVELSYRAISRKRRKVVITRKVSTTPGLTLESKGAMQIGGQELQVNGSLPPTNLGMLHTSMSLIKGVRYEIWVTVKPLRGFSKGLCMKLPITIGTIPLYGNMFKTHPDSIPYISMAPSVDSLDILIGEHGDDQLAVRRY